jgi:DNA modification methylase
MNSELQIEQVALTDIKPYKNNAKKHPAEQVANVAESIRTLGWRQPIVLDKDGVIIIGHGRFLAAKQLGLETAPCHYAYDLTPEQTKKLRLLDNKLNESEWDFDLLKLDIEGLDFSNMTLDWGIEETLTQTPVVEDEPPAVDNNAPPITQLGDIWQLGEHRLICGDSTNALNINILMQGKKADLVFTDPPYNINYQGVSDKRQIMNDKMGDEDFIKFLEKSIPKTDTAYVCCSWQYAHLFKKAMENIGMPPKAMIIWNKVNPAQHLDKYFKQHEIIWYYGKFGGEKTLRGDIWECKRQKNTVHPTMKPIELIAMALQDNPNKKIVYDGFGGSGSTLIACEQLNRVCYMCELDPKYCDVIVRRWETLTGKKAELLKGE